jgi:glycosyltransferase involved in cell wall biosynthesis
MKKNVLVVAPALSQSGYGVHARTVLRSLRSRSDLYEIFIHNLNWGQTSWLWEDDNERRWIDERMLATVHHQQSGGTYDISLQVTIPNEWKKLAPINIGCTAGIEATKITPQWIQQSYLMDKIIVVSNFAREGFINTVHEMTHGQTGEKVGVSAKGPIEVVNYPYVPTESADIELPLACDFNFLLVSQWSPRKNFENTIRWFIEEFIDQNVGLIVKTSTANNSYLDFVHTKNRIEQLLNEPQYADRKCKVNLLHGYLTKGQMKSVYTHPNVKCLINIAHGEGFGLPMLEAAGAGLPVLTVGWGGQADFLYMPEKRKGSKKKTMVAKFAEVDFTVGPISPEAVWEGVLHADAFWAFPEQGSFKMKLRDVHKKYRVYKNRAAALKSHIQSEFTEEKKFAEFCSHLEEYAFNVDNWMNELSDIVKEYE